MRILLLPRIERRLLIPTWRQISPTAVPDSAWRNAYATCSSENFERFIGPILSALGTPKAPPYCSSNLSSFSGETSLLVPLLFVSDSRIVLGPTVESAANVQFVLERLLLERQLYGPTVTQSTISYRR